jgi:HSP20 family protein
MSTRALSRTNLAPSLFTDFFSPWNEWFDDDRFFNKTMTMPAVNIMENNNHYTVSLAAPGLKKDDFKIDLDGNMLTISSEKEEEKEQKDEKITKKEYNYSSFSRSFTLPEDVKNESIDARYDNGVLNITLPKKEGAKKSGAPKRISIK